MKRIGEVLVKDGYITEEQLKEALKLKDASGQRLGEALLQNGLIKENALADALSKIYKIQYVDLTKTFIDKKITEEIPMDIVKKHTIMPLYKVGNILTVALFDPSDVEATDNLSKLTGLELNPVLATKSDIENAIKVYYDGRKEFLAVHSDTDDISVISSEVSTVTSEFITNEIKQFKNDESEPALLLKKIIKLALLQEAGAVYFFSYEKSVTVKYKIDGIFHTKFILDLKTYRSILNKISIMVEASPDVNKDNKRALINFKNINYVLHIGEIKNQYGLSLALNIRKLNDYIKKLNSLGFEKEEFETLIDILSKPRGLVIFTGPESNGKTALMYSALNYLNSGMKNIISIEKQVKFYHSLWQQLEYDNEYGIFDEKIDKLMKFSPDVMMFSYIGQEKYFNAALFSAVAGKLVLGGMYADNPAYALYYLLKNKEINNFNLATALIGIVGMRLIKLNCEYCKEEYKPSQYYMKKMNLNTNVKYYKGVGCSYCNFTGYKGVTGIYQVLSVTKEMKNLIFSEPDLQSVYAQVVKDTKTTLAEKAIMKAVAGLTSVEEAYNATFKEF